MSFKPLNSKRFLAYFKLFTILAITMCFIITLAMSIYTSLLLQQNANMYGSNAFTLLMDSQNAMFGQLSQVLGALYNDSTYLRYMNYYANKDIQRQLEIMESLTAYTTTSSMIRNICFYYPEHQTTLSTKQSVSDLRYYCDKDFLLQIETSETLSKAYVRQVHYPSEKIASKVVTLVRSLPLSAHQDGITAYLLIDLDYSVLMKSFEKMVISNDGSMMLYDETGSLIASIGFSYMLDDLFPDGIPHLQNILSTKREVNGETLYIYSCATDDPHWNYVYVQNLSSVLQELRNAQIFIVSLGIAVIVLALIYAWQASRILYKPIQKATEKMGNPEGEFFDHITLMIEENERLSAELQNNAITGRNRKLLHQVLHGFGSIEQSNELQMLVPSGQECAVYLLKISAETKDIEQEELQQLLTPFGIELVIKLYTAPKEIALIVTSNSFSFDTLCESGNKLLMAADHESASVGVSKPFTQLAELSPAYYQAKEALDMELIRGTGHSCCFLELRNKPTSEYPYHLENAILHAFGSADRKSIEQSVVSFEQHLINSEARPQHVRDFYVQLFCSCQRLMVDKNCNPEEMMNYSHREMLSQGSIRRMSVYIANMLCDLLDSVYQVKDNSVKERVGQICAYIDNHLDSMVSTNELASYFFISPNTLRSEFSKVMGVSLKSYIEQKKIETAKQLLLIDRLRVQDVATKVGFQYSQSFILFFKNAVGVTPGEFRSQAMASGSKESPDEGMDPDDE